MDGYRIINATEHGRVLATQKRDATSVQAALQAALRDLAPYFGTPPVASSGYESAKDGKSGGAKFTVTANGQSLRGLIFCQVGPEGANIAVAFAAENAPPEEWKRLTNGPRAAGRASQSGAPAPSGAPAQAGPIPAGPSRAPAPPALHASMTAYRFPDGTGTMSLAPGWHTNSRSQLGGITVTGPGDQLMQLGFPFTVVTPNSQLARSQRTMRMPGPPLLVAPFTTPLEVYKTLAPQLSRASMHQGGPGFSIDNPVLITNYKAGDPRGRAAKFSVGVTERNRHYKAIVQVELTPIPPESISVWQSSFRAPDATFDRDYPLMMEMANTVRENGKVVNSKMNADIASRQRQADAFQAQQKAKSDAFFDNLHQSQRDSNARIQAVEDNERASNQRLRSADDTDEYIRGVRTVEDTRTGEKASVDLGAVDKIVDGLNEHDPERYRQIPLRDEAHPDE
jgi:hypothetical protein